MTLPEPVCLFCFSIDALKSLGKEDTEEIPKDTSLVTLMYVVLDPS